MRKEAKKRQSVLECLYTSDKYIEDIYFFEVNTKYISSSVLKTSEFSWVRSTNENFNVFNSRDEI